MCHALVPPYKVKRVNFIANFVPPIEEITLFSPRFAPHLPTLAKNPDSAKKPLKPLSRKRIVPMCSRSVLRWRSFEPGHQPGRRRHGLGYRPAAAADNSGTALWRRSGDPSRAEIHAEGFNEGEPRPTRATRSQPPGASRGLRKHRKPITAPAHRSPLDPELAKQLGYDVDDDDSFRPARNKMESCVKATADSLEALLREDAQFRKDDGSLKV